MPNRQVQQLSQESAAHAAAAIPPNYNSRSAKMSLFAVVRTGYRAVELITSAR